MWGTVKELLSKAKTRPPLGIDGLKDAIKFLM